MRGTYTRWTRKGSKFLADILGSRFDIGANSETGQVTLTVSMAPGSAAGVAPKVDLDMDPDEARMIGVRLIEAAVHADGERAIRSTA